MSTGVEARIDKQGNRLPAGAFGAGAVAVGVAVAILVVEGDAFGEGVAMDAQDDGGVREVMGVFVERLFDVELLELGEGLVEEDSPLQHLIDQRFQSGAHQEALRCSASTFAVG